MEREATAMDVAPEEVGEALLAVRLCVPEAQLEMRRSLSVLGQLTPVQVYREDGKLELIDGFKRLHAARAMSWPRLRAEVQQVDAAGAKVRLWPPVSGKLSPRLRRRTAGGDEQGTT